MLPKPRASPQMPAETLSLPGSRGMARAPQLGARSQPRGPAQRRLGGRGCQRHAADCACPRGDVLLVEPSRNTAWERLPGAGVRLLLRPGHRHHLPSRSTTGRAPSACREVAELGLCPGSPRWKAQQWTVGTQELQGRRPGARSSRPWLVGECPRARRSPPRAPPRAPRWAGAVSPVRLRRREQLPAAALYGQGRGGRPRCHPERGARPGPPRASLGDLTCAPAGAMAPGAGGCFARVSGPGPGRRSPEVCVPGEGSPAPPPPAPPAGRGARAPALPRRLPPTLRSRPRRDRRDPPGRPPLPRPGTPGAAAPGTWQGAEQAAGGGEAEQGAPRPLHAGPIRAGSAGGTGAAPGRDGGRGGAGSTWCGPGGAGRGRLPPPALPAPPASPSGPAPAPLARPRTVPAPPSSVPGTFDPVWRRPPHRLLVPASPGPGRALLVQSRTGPGILGPVTPGSGREPPVRSFPVPGVPAPILHHPITPCWSK